MSTRRKPSRWPPEAIEDFDSVFAGKKSIVTDSVIYEYFTDRHNGIMRPGEDLLWGFHEVTLWDEVLSRMESKLPIPVSFLEKVYNDLDDEDSDEDEEEIKAFRKAILKGKRTKNPVKRLPSRRGLMPKKIYIIAITMKDGKIFAGIASGTSFNSRVFFQKRFTGNSITNVLEDVADFLKDKTDAYWKDVFITFPSVRSIPAFTAVDDSELP